MYSYESVLISELGFAQKGAVPEEYDSAPQEEREDSSRPHGAKHNRWDTDAATASHDVEYGTHGSILCIFWQIHADQSSSAVCIALIERNTNATTQHVAT